MRDWPAVTIVIPNYNGAALLRANLPSVCAAADRYPGRCDVVVVDDGSSDAAAATAVTDFPEIRLIRHAHNRGFAEAVHTGVAAAATPVLVLLNSDVTPAAGFLAPLVAALDAPDVFAVGPLIRRADGTVDRVSWHRRRWRRGRLAQMTWNPEQLTALTGPVPALSVSGGSMAVDRTKFLELEGFASLYKPFYYEDEDLCARAWRRGWSCRFEPRSEVVHGDDGAIRSNVAVRDIKVTQRRNRFFYEWSHCSPQTLWLRLFPHYLRQLIGRLVTFDWLYLLGLYRALRGIGAVRRHRRAIARAAPRRSFEQVLALIEQTAPAHAATTTATPDPSLVRRER